MNNQSNADHAPSESFKPGAPRMPAIVSRLNLLLHVSATLVSLSVAFTLYDGTLFGWHPLFMSLGFMLFMTEGLIGSVMFRQLDGPERVQAIWAHALMQGRAFVCILIGFVVIYQNKVRHGKSHFVSQHAKFGLATLLLSIASPLLGLISFKRLGILQRFPEAWHPRLKWLHRRAGVVTWLLALITIELTLNHHAVKRGILTPIWQASVAAMGLLMLLLLQKAQLKFKDERDGSLAKAV